MAAPTMQQNQRIQKWEFVHLQFADQVRLAEGVRRLEPEFMSLSPSASAKLNGPNPGDDVWHPGGVFSIKHKIFSSASVARNSGLKLYRAVTTHRTKYYFQQLMAVRQVVWMACIVDFTLLSACTQQRATTWSIAVRQYGTGKVLYKLNNILGSVRWSVVIDVVRDKFKRLPHQPMQCHMRGPGQSPQCWGTASLGSSDLAKGVHLNKKVESIAKIQRAAPPVPDSSPRLH
jgi:hypothetical protein